MLKVPRFMKEYAAFTEKRLMEYAAENSIDPKIVGEKIIELSRIIRQYERGFITVKDAMTDIGDIHF